MFEFKNLKKVLIKSHALKSSRSKGKILMLASEVGGMLIRLKNRALYNVKIQRGIRSRN